VGTGWRGRSLFPPRLRQTSWPLILPLAVARARSKAGHSGEASRRVREGSRLVRVSHPALRPLSRLSTFNATGGRRQVQKVAAASAQPSYSIARPRSSLTGAGWPESNLVRQPLGRMALGIETGSAHGVRWAG
jgi:hypothetical protein